MYVRIFIIIYSSVYLCLRHTIWDALAKSSASLAILKILLHISTLINRLALGHRYNEVQRRTPT